MTTEVCIGLGLALAAGMMAGNCMLPAKFVRRWKWENVWLVFTLVSLVIMPWTLAVLKVERLRDVYAGLPLSVFVVPFLFGMGWGIAQVLFGLSIARLGMALGYAVIVGLGALLGSLVPLFFQRRAVLSTDRGVIILAGVTLMVIGIAVSGRAGQLRERPACGKSVPGANGSYGSALLLGILCGLMAPMLNYSLAFGDGIGRAAMELGTPATDANYAVWPIGLTGGLIPNLAYSLFLLARNRTWDRFALGGRDLLMPVFMGLLWMGAMATYGVGASYLGALGTSVGWALFQIFMIMTANISGVATGEWKTAGTRARTLLWTGLTLLAIATVVISLGNRE